MVVAAFPTRDWARRVYPDLDEEEAYEKFIDEVFDIVRVDGNDPIENWNAHVKSLSVHAKRLQEKNYKALHYISEGTDLTVGLPKDTYGKMRQVMSMEMDNRLLPIFLQRKCLLHLIEIM